VSRGFDIQKNCPGCGVSIGVFHTDNCDVARCALTGHQRWGDSHTDYDCNTVWYGIWPGIAECHEYDLWNKWTDKGWEICSRDDPEAREDLNTLAMYGVWSIAQQKMVIS